jgi:hypothetical protein
MCAARLKELLGEECDKAIMVPSCTAALEMAAILCDLKAGDEVGLLREWDCFEAFDLLRLPTYLCFSLHE